MLHFSTAIRRTFTPPFTCRYTYVETLEGPWLLYDNLQDPYQKNNQIGNSAYDGVRRELAQALARKLQKLGDDFTHSERYYRQWNYDKDYPINTDGTTIRHNN